MRRNLFRSVGTVRAVLALGAFLAGALPARAADTKLPEDPTWWIGVAGAANLNLYEGTTQVLNGSTTTAAPFHEGFGIGPFVAARLEYRHDARWGGFLDAGYDDRRGTFDAVTCPCGETARLSARPAYLSIEPNLRVAPFEGNFHLFAGPRVGFLMSPLTNERAFRYERDGKADVRQNFSAMRGVTVSGQFGAGYDFRWTIGTNGVQAKLSPFVSYQPHFGQDPRDTDHDMEWWALSTVRLGVALVFGRARAPAGEPDFRATVSAPARAVVARRIEETFPLRNYVYFDADESRESADFASRYARLAPNEAASFREERLQEKYPAQPTGRTARQMIVYRNILNILGDRLRRNPNAVITLKGLYAPESLSGSGQGLARAEAVKRYLTATFGVREDRIAVEAAEEPRLPLGRTPEDLDMLRAESRRVEIHTRSPELLVQVGEGFMLRPVEIGGDEGVDSVVFRAADMTHGRGRGHPRATESADSLASWTVEVTSGAGATWRLGPFRQGRAAVPAALFLANAPADGVNRAPGHFTAVVTGAYVRRGAEGEAARPSRTIRRELSFDLARKGTGVETTARFAILFDIDEARAVSAYDLFLARAVAPRIADGATVFIRGRTDVVTDAAYNLRLSKDRAQGVLRNLEAIAAREGRRGVSFKPSWTGEDPAQAPYGNALPEERNYNRTVIIDIVPQ
jgi:outer membrane protein OmpA-like peptidoglycan-associated protein